MHHPGLSAPSLEVADKSDEAKPSASTGDAKVDDDDVKLVVAQTGCSEEKAREALKAENGDLINASE
jgi:nascent polypeptide-associated complex subunit alpha